MGVFRTFWDCWSYWWIYGLRSGSCWLEVWELGSFVSYSYSYGFFTLEGGVLGVRVIRRPVTVVAGDSAQFWLFLFGGGSEPYVEFADGS